MKRVPTLVVLSILVAAPAAAQTTDTAAPGVIAADSPLYGLDIAADKLLKPPGERAHERASEALVAQEANDSQARDRALRELNTTAREANGLRDGEGLENAQAVLTELQDKVPAEAQPGIETALDNVIKAKNRLPTDKQPNETDRGPGDGQPGPDGLGGS